jgi:hypothetical protein
MNKKHIIFFTTEIKKKKKKQIAIENVKLTERKHGVNMN